MSAKEEVKKFMAMVKEVRKRKNINQKEIALRLGISDKTYSQIERGVSPLHADQMLVLIDILDLSLDGKNKETELAVLPNDYKDFTLILLKKLDAVLKNQEETQERLSKLEEITKRLGGD